MAEHQRTSLIDIFWLIDAASIHLDQRSRSSNGHPWRTWCDPCSCSAAKVMQSGALEILESGSLNQMIWKHQEDQEVFCLVQKPGLITVKTCKKRWEALIRFRKFPIGPWCENKGSPKAPPSLLMIHLASFGYASKVFDRKKNMVSHRKI